MALHALSVVFSERLVVDIERCSTALDLHVVPPLCPLGVNAADFSQADTLIRRGYESTRAWLEAGEPKQAVARLRPHAHPA